MSSGDDSHARAEIRHESHDWHGVANPNPTPGIRIVAGAGYLPHRAWRKPMVTGAPGEMPPLVEKVTNTLDHMADKIMHPGQPRRGDAAAGGEAERADAVRGDALLGV